MFAQRLAGHILARIPRALNDAGIPCPSAADRGRNPHRTGAAWTLRTVAAILANPRYTGRQVWNRQRTDSGSQEKVLLEAVQTDQSADAGGSTRCNVVAPAPIAAESGSGQRLAGRGPEPFSASSTSR